MNVTLTTVLYTCRFEEAVCSKITKPSDIVMDNESYHSAKHFTDEERAVRIKISPVLILEIFYDIIDYVCVLNVQIFTRNGKMETLSTAIRKQLIEYLAANKPTRKRRCDTFDMAPSAPPLNLKAPTSMTTTQPPYLRQQQQAQPWPSCHQ